MNPTTYGRSNLTFCNNLSRRVLSRLAEALAEMPDAPGQREQSLMTESIRQKLANLQSVFPGQSLLEWINESPNPSDVKELIYVVATCWIDAVQSLADDNELDVQRSGKTLAEIISEEILDDALLAGRLVEIRRLRKCTEAIQYR